MDIELETGEVIQNVNPIKSLDEITTDCRVFYELGGYERWSYFYNKWVNWKSFGVFNEIKNPMKFKKGQQYKIDNNINKNFSDPSYVKHHNFVISKK